MRFVLVLALPFFLAAPALAADIYVPDNYATIQDAINAAVNGDSVIVRPGTYVENIDFIGKSITVRSEMGADATVIDGNDNGSVVSFVNLENDSSVLEGFTLTNGNAGSGGGILCRDSFPIVIRNIVKDNYGYYGGGVYCSGSDTNFTLNIFSGNSSVAGGGLCLHYNSSPSLIGNLIFGNSSAWSGGVEIAYSCAPTLINNTISGNTASNQGGGIYCMCSSTPAILNTILCKNIAKSGQGPEIWIGKSHDPSTVNIDYSAVEGGQSSVYVDASCTLNWGLNMIAADPRIVDPDNNDFHLCYTSPCKDAGDTTAVPPDLLEDFEGDPRLGAGTVDMGADEFNTRLYQMGDAVPGGIIQFRVVGIPSAPVTLAMGAGIQDPPQSTMYGDFYLKWPLLQVSMGTTSAHGVVAYPATVPTGWVAGDEKPFQGLVGPLGSIYSELTNLHVLVVQ